MTGSCYDQHGLLYSVSVGGDDVVMLSCYGRDVEIKPQEVSEACKGRVASGSQLRG